MSTLPSNAARKARFLAELRRRYHIHVAARAAGVARATIYNWRRDDPAFRDALEEARTHVADDLEETAIAKALAGDTQMLIFLLKAIRGEVFNPIMRVGAADDAAITIRVEYGDAPGGPHTKTFL